VLLERLVSCRSPLDYLRQLWDLETSRDLVVALVVSLVTLLAAAARRRIGDEISQARVRKRFPEFLNHYEASLRAKSLQVRHSWLRRGQTVADTLVPIQVKHADGRGR